MLDEKDLQAIAQLMDLKLKPINEQLNKMQDDIEILKDDSKVTRNAVNNLLDWAEDASIQAVPLLRKPNNACQFCADSDSLFPNYE